MDEENQPGAGGAASGTQQQNGQSGTVPANNLPTDIPGCHALISSLRQENASHRRRATDAENRVQELTTEKQSLESRFASADTNVQSLLQSKDTEITTLRAQLTEQKSKLDLYAVAEDAQRTTLLTRLPETLRDRYKTLPIDTLTSLVEDLAANTATPPGKSPGTQPPAGRGVTDDPEAELERALASGDDAAIDAALAKVEDLYSK